MGDGEIALRTRPVRQPREHSRAVLLGLVKARRRVSRARLARESRLALPTVMEIVSGLIREGVVQEVGAGRSTGGRRPRLLSLVPSSYSAIGISVGTSRIAAVVTDLDARVGGELSEASSVDRGRSALEDQLHRLIRHLVSERGTGPGRLLGVGLALMGPVPPPHARRQPDAEDGDAWSVAVERLVPPDLGVPVVADNYANALAVGEHLYGAGQGVRNLVCIVLQRGLGAGIIIEGRLYRGSTGGAGEIGDALIDPRGPQCPCGRFGCLTAYVGQPAIRERALERMRLVGAIGLAGLRPEHLTAESVVMAALDGDRVAREVMQEVGTYLGIGIANLIGPCDPDRVVLAGPTARASPIIIPAAQSVVDRRLTPRPSVPIVKGELGDNAAAVGAASLVLSNLFAPTGLVQDGAGDQELELQAAE